MSTPIGGPLSSASSTTLGSQMHGSPVPHMPDRGRPTFGVDLAEQMIRDNVEVPRVMTRLCAAIEKWGIDSTGIYRLSGSVSKVTKLKSLLDRGKSIIGFDFPIAYS